jgi:hypothetical protein
MAFGLDSLASTVFLCPSMIVTATNAVDSSRVDQSGQASLNLKRKHLRILFLLT